MSWYLAGVYLEKRRDPTAIVLVERLKQVVGWDELAGRSTAIADATGVGTPVVDLLRRAGLTARGKSSCFRTRSGGPEKAPQTRKSS